ncbi:MAG TPA: DUF2510 domain-containing protein [Acidimicrobiales bacterium]|jgi:hypothetical protein|nr:DUF2510 domain-containing protein [Acidimicrobiales bacterium]
MQTSTTELIVIGVLSILWAAIGYRLSEGVRKLTGRTPWGLPSPVWALLWFLSVVLGLVLFLIARATDARRAVRMGPGHPGVPGESLGTGPTAPMAKPIRAGSQFPAYPRPANSPGLGEPEPSHLPPPPPPTPQAESGTQPVAAPDPAPATPGAPEAGAQPLPPPGWHPDPSGRFHYRWWDGTMWTSQVSLSGQHLIDTNPDQRIGQY